MEEEKKKNRENKGRGKCVEKKRTQVASLYSHALVIPERKLMYGILFSCCIAAVTTIIPAPIATTTILALSMLYRPGSWLAGRKHTCSNFAVDNVPSFRLHKFNITAAAIAAAATEREGTGGGGGALCVYLHL